MFHHSFTNATQFLKTKIISIEAREPNEPYLLNLLELELKQTNIFFLKNPT